ncbi:MAG TPA: hypothetical protein PKK06_11675 [Phycisphaerae bacterium]|nr:hypothetical protein [Phycisphaerae bacterium]HNU45879.1 hypothetical protein [Phycisphaerae bacterium]
MDLSDRLEQFTQEFPFPWSTAPGALPDEPCRRLEAETTQALMNFEAFVERFREQLALRDERSVAGTPTLVS